MAKKMWCCQICGFIYDEAKGRPAEGIPAGTAWQDVPSEWTCPDCGADKASFDMQMMS
ncbi:rubredoxin [Motilimonas eburnea]|uniref:rubredoxin n=1 Tax=Motilimonas eburnea TaxID=1737488 RepID=UPI001E419B34|nr:rubredoxin [Motilimonas eburnea]MCE2571245.1 rubredoxin [Motilimonas eburnea]